MAHRMLGGFFRFFRVKHADNPKKGGAPGGKPNGRKNFFLKNFKNLLITFFSPGRGMVFGFFLGGPRKKGLTLEKTSFWIFGDPGVFFSRNYLPGAKKGGVVSQTLTPGGPKIGQRGGW